MRHRRLMPDFPARFPGEPRVLSKKQRLTQIRERRRIEGLRILARIIARLKEATGLTWDGLATAIGVDTRQVLRWRKKGCEPSGGAMLSLVDFALQVKGGLAILTGRDVVVTVRGRE